MERMGDRPIIVWFRRDLRVADNPALLYAARSGAPVLPVYVSDWECGDTWAPGQAGRWWLERSLACLSASLAARGTPLVTVPGRPEEALPALARAIGAGEVVSNRLYEPYSRNLDSRVAATLERDGVGFTSFNAGLLFEPEGVATRAGKPFVQFTAFWRCCRSLPEPEPPLPAPETRVWPAAAAPEITAPPWVPLAAGGWSWEPGEAGAWMCLQRFLELRLDGYDAARDFPGIEGTARLSPHLHFGEIGPRQVWHAVQEIVQHEAGRRGAAAPSAVGAGVGATAFLRQLGWREFAHYLLFHFPWITDEPFRPEFADFPWADDPAGLEAWKRGVTGYPLVDAGMKQLLAEGWMHNRVRMVAASFLTKDLLVPWQQGAAWFWDRLMDADLANNTLGWQWMAGSGPDAAPYFRVFNPVLQARRFDAEGAYVRWWTAAPGAAAEEPVEPRPIVEHDEARARALAAFRGLRSSGGDARKAVKHPLPSDIQI
jgi:deoxyribodipyrimidine photo-lyase